MEAAIARSHRKLWWGDLVISSRASRHPEEQTGEVSAFMIGETCFAWWSKDQLRQLAEERRKAERELMREDWSRVAKKETAPEGLNELERLRCTARSL